MELVEYYNANPKRNLAKHKGKQLQQDQFDQTFSSCEKSTLPAAPPKRIPIVAATKFSRNHFDPTPTTSGKCPNLRIDVLLDNRVFVAGAHVHGRLEVSCNTDSKIHIGEVLMEFVGYEEVKEKDFKSTQVFLTAKVVFQKYRKVPPSSVAVRGPAQAGGYWLANKGKTTYPFAFKLPLDAPSSFEFQNIASLNYVCTGVVQYMYNGKKDTLFKSKKVQILENLSSYLPLLPSTAIETHQITGKHQMPLGKKFLVTLQGKLQKLVHYAGSDVFLEVRVKNETRQMISGLKVTLARNLLVLLPTGKLKITKEIIKVCKYSGKQFRYDAGEERSNMLDIHSPALLKTVRNTAMSEIACTLTVELNMGVFNKNISIQIPILIHSSASIQPPNELNPHKNLHPQIYNKNRLELQEYVAPPPKKGFGNVFKRRDSKGKPRLPWDGEGVEIDDDVYVLKWESDDARRIEDISQDPDSYTPAHERSRLLKKKSSSFYPQDSASFNADNNNQIESVLDNVYTFDTVDGDFQEKRSKKTLGDSHQHVINIPGKKKSKPKPSTSKKHHDEIKQQIPKPPPTAPSMKKQRIRAPKKLPSINDDEKDFSIDCSFLQDSSQVMNSSTWKIKSKQENSRKNSIELFSSSIHKGKNKRNSADPHREKNTGDIMLRKYSQKLKIRNP